MVLYKVGTQKGIVPLWLELKRILLANSILPATIFVFFSGIFFKNFEFQEIVLV